MEKKLLKEMLANGDVGLRHDFEDVVGSYSFMGFDSVFS